MEDNNHRPLLEWRPIWDNPDLRGWCVVAAYILAATVCARAALRSGADKSERPIWGFLAVLLLALGINKQLSLQTLFIVLGRRAAFSQGWYEYRRGVQIAFTVAFTIGGIVAFRIFYARFHKFFQTHRWALAGTIILVLFILDRCASINHIWVMLHWTEAEKDADKNWTWILEILGAGCLALAAERAGAKRRSPLNSSGGTSSARP